MAAESFIITELEGSRRSVVLSDRALPYKPLEAPGEQLVVQKWYPGSRVATLQVLGPREGDWEIKGTWKTIFLAAKGMVRLTGFGDIPNTDGRITAEDLVEVFHRLRIAGNTLEVSWGPEVRRGILERFKPGYQVIQDIEWTASFKWSQRGSNAPARASFALDTTATVRRSLDDLDLTAAEMPATILPGPATTIRDRLNAVRSSGVALTESLASAQAAAFTTIADVQDIQALAERTVQAAEALRSGELSDLPYVELLALDDVSSAVAVETWRRDMGARTRDVQAASMESAGAVEKRLTPGAEQTYTVRENESLRRLALRFYGSADDWTLIADANNLVGSDVPVGTRLVIPRSSGQGVTAR